MDHYELFGVARDVSPAELRRAYRRLAARHHPDRNRDDAAAATRRMAEINEAFATLVDPVRRFDYDRRLGRSGAPSARRTERAASPPEQAAPGTPPPTPAPADDPVRRARREAKERQAAEARARRYRDPGGGFFEGSRHH